MAISNTQKLKLASLLAAAGWALVGLSSLLTGDTAGALEKFLAAITTAGLPSVWLKGWVITVPENPAETLVEPKPPRGTLINTPEPEGRRPVPPPPPPLKPDFRR